MDYSYDLEGGPGPTRKKSLVRPERARIDQNHPKYHYNRMAAQQAGRINIRPSTTGNDPNIVTAHNETGPSGHNMIPLQEMGNRVSRVNEEEEPYIDQLEGVESYTPEDEHALNDGRYGNLPDNGRVVEGLNDEAARTLSRSSASSGLSYNDTFEEDNAERYYEQHSDPYGATELADNTNDHADQPLTKKSRRPWKREKRVKEVNPKGPPPSLWRFYCFFVTFWAPPFVMRWFGMPTRDRQIAWREKVGLVSCIMLIAAFVAYLTFGFTETVCKSDTIRIHINDVNDGFLIIHAQAYDLTTSTHPAAQGVPANSNILYPPVNAGGMDASFMFQNVNGHCKGLLTPKSNSSIPTNGDELAWYMPCRTFAQDGSTKPNFTEEYYNGWACHTSSIARKAFWDLKVSAQVYFNWDDLKNSSRNLVVFNGDVLDLDLINWIQTADINVPDKFYQFQNDSSIHGIDVSTIMASGVDRQIFRCLSDIAKVGFVDSDPIGCIASKVVLYVSLTFIVSVVVIKFLFAVYFRWVISGRQGANYMTNKELAKRDNMVEDWSENPYTLGPVKAVKRTDPKSKSRKSVFVLNDNIPYGNITMASQNPSSSTSKVIGGSSVYLDGAASRSSLMPFSDDPFSRGSVVGAGSRSIISADTSYRGFNADVERGSSAFDLLDNMPDQDVADPDSPDYVVPQPPIDYQPFGFPLAHTMCLVTAYSESIDGLRTTLDSIATTDYPNSHKMILVICDGLIKGAGNDMTTPDITLSMMKDFVEPPETVQAYSYVSVVSGSKRHNMAKVYAGFYKYDDDTMDPSKQQRIPMITVVKCGTPAEATTPKPGNRGKRDSQIILMSFLQRVMFDERMTELDYELFNGIWKVTGIAVDFYEIILMVDADTKVFPDSLTHMVACMVKDPQIMGLCGETKIANKRDSWVTAIQVFEYYISHHSAKAFESVFSGVTCLPGCFSMYRIKAPKGNDGYWVPILCNPDIVERYADNVIDTLHKKNLLLLGEDRYLTSLMLQTFPKRKQIFVPKAVCKTIVPNEFKVLLSQRRRWINSTVHNLMELVLVRDLCGVFCISMQFCIFIELVGTLVLPAAISFTIYVIILSIVRKPTPILSLVLLALILGLPGVLIVVTATRFSYIVWMMIYLMALPVWNFVLPMYAYWKFDDFSWGETRAIAGGDKGGHDDAEGEFDSSQIIMKRWRDFEREKRRFAQPGPSNQSYGMANNSSLYLYNNGSSTYSPSMSASFTTASGMVAGNVAQAPSLPANHFDNLAEQRANNAANPATGAWMEAVGEAGSSLNPFASHSGNSLHSKSQVSLVSSGKPLQRHQLQETTNYYENGLQDVNMDDNGLAESGQSEYDEQQYMHADEASGAGFQHPEQSLIDHQDLISQEPSYLGDDSQQPGPHDNMI